MGQKDYMPITRVLREAYEDILLQPGYASTHLTGFNYAIDSLCQALEIDDPLFERIEFVDAIYRPEEICQ